ncbi:winged helix-turn-helix domain-containing protein [Glycomyces sp. A-F 0318]|uniref:BTAD domain-containing putative transcriptional regulator n=1 Tax=Glycomyces amatae TaxID=2881355 RepID=UPI001E53B09C|nr:BTAD domain-containing putative transcriptional regulator [Glycomyces amatae]MCD0442231.1 winged helix-turn-helix domain-containing protein [Glycomyces amatae]
MRVLLLGPFAVRDDEDQPVELAGARLRALVARLALEPGREISADTLTDAVWEGEAPSANALQALVSRVRRAVGAERLTRGTAGYRLALDPADVDVLRFERLAETGRRGDLAALREAESLWRGAAFADLLDLRFARAEAVRLERLRSETARERLALEIAAGADVLAELEPVAAAHPLDERWQALLMRALYATGRPAEALDVFERTRGRLADELGADPSAELAELHLHVLRRSAAPTARPERRRSNLKAQLTSLVGREADLEALAAALAAARLVTVTGPGGAGKTRLAVEAAARMSDLAPQGVWLVELAAVVDDADVAPAVLRAVGAREAGLLEPSAHDAASRLEEYFADQDALVVLDNCEHRIGAAAALAARLLGACPGLRILATSREALAIGGERLYPIPPLPLSADRPEESPAVRLFCERAAAVRPGFALDAANTPAVVEICRRLDGLPLAVELAAARMRALDAAQIAARLDDRFALLAGADRTAPERHRTLEGVIAWSWELLSDAERALAMWMSVYPGGVGLDRVGDLGALAGLVDKSLVEHDGGRYRMLETIRSYAAARLDRDGDGEAERDAMARYCVDLAERSDDETRSAVQLEAMARLDAEHDNLLAVLGRSVANGDKETGLRMVAALFWYWHLRGFRSQLQHWFAAVLGLPGEVPAPLRPAVLLMTGMSQSQLGDPEAGARSITEGIALGRKAGGGIAGRALMAIAPAFLSDPDVAGDLASAGGWERGIVLLTAAAVGEGSTGPEGAAQVERAEAEFTVLGERFGLASVLRMRAEYWARRGDHDAAREALARAARLLDELGTAADAAETYAELGLATALGGAVERAWEPLALASERTDADRDPHTTAYVRWCRAQVLLHAGDRAEALRELDAAERVFDGSVEDSRVQVWGAALRAVAALAEGDAALARRRLGALTSSHLTAAADPNLAVAARVGAAVALADGGADRAATLLGAAFALLGAADGRGYDAALRTPERAREALGDRAFEESFERGTAMGRDAAVELLLAESARG